MNVFFRAPLAAVVTVTISIIPAFVHAQQLSCDSIKEVVAAAAADSTLNSIKAGVSKQDKGSEGAEYYAKVSLWDRLDDVRGQYISYDNYHHRYTFNAFWINEGSGKEEMDETVQTFRKCLGEGWILKKNVDALGDTATFFKNTVNYVVVSIVDRIGEILIECYNDSRSRNAECISGDCNNYFGSSRYFNEDYYSGSFINGTQSGIGSIYWYDSKMTYKGSFIDNQAAGNGELYNKDNELVKSGIFFKGNLVKVDTSLKTCQFGDCENGFGLKVLEGGYFVGNFKNGLTDGPGELVTARGTAFGYYKSNRLNGRGIIVNSNGAFIIANFVDGQAAGKYETLYANGTSLEANITDKSGVFFDEDNMLLKAGAGTQSAFTEKTDPAYLYLKGFVKSLKEFYSYRPGGYQEIRGEQNKLLKKLGMQGGYKSTLSFQKIYPAIIDVDHNRYYFVTIYLSGNASDKSKWPSLYNKYYDLLHHTFGTRWRAVADNGRATLKKTSGSYVLENIFDKSKSVSLSVDQRGVQMEIH